jgi:hypothetical protein
MTRPVDKGMIDFPNRKHYFRLMSQISGKEIYSVDNIHDEIKKLLLELAGVKHAASVLFI